MTFLNIIFIIYVHLLKTQISLICINVINILYIGLVGGLLTELEMKTKVHGKQYEYFKLFVFWKTKVFLKFYELVYIIELSGNRFDL